MVWALGMWKVSRIEVPGNIMGKGGPKKTWKNRVIKDMREKELDRGGTTPRSVERRLTKTKITKNVEPVEMK